MLARANIGIGKAGYAMAPASHIKVGSRDGPGCSTCCYKEDSGLGVCLVEELSGLPSGLVLPLVSVRAGNRGVLAWAGLQYLSAGLCAGSGDRPGWDVLLHPRVCMRPR